MAKKSRNLIGKRFGKLLVLKSELRLETGNRNRTFYYCRCNCGNERWYRNSSISSGTKSCGCLNRELLSNANKLKVLPNFRAIKTNLYLQYKRKGRRARELEFNLTREEFEELIEDNCYYCGIKPNTKAEKNKQTFFWNGIDRLDSSKGYTKNNCVTCCKDCNKAKCEMSEEDFKMFIKRVYEHLYN